MSTLSTHVLDSTYGVPAVGMRVTVSDADGTDLATTTTDVDGRVRFDLDLDLGLYLIGFETGVWFAEHERDTFFPAVALTFEVDTSDDHFHVALLLSPYSYTTYRGS
ncbi:hydroxyisourate hydrolase [Nocardioides hankookensis]|uniref:5-hydroxyisourate hydrolase n=1 Tax=Nocardioides hankookensis TaxID=443157 RepID=A0ABW1LI45_9ACTN